MTGQDVARRDPVAVARAEDERQWDHLWRRATVLSKTNLVPKACQGSPDTTMAALLTLDALGVAPNVLSLNQLHFVEGRPDPSAQMLAGLLGQRGYQIDWLETGPEQATARLVRPDGTVTGTITWTIGQARAAGLLDEWVEKRVEDGRWPDGNKRYRTEKFVLGRAGVDEPDWVDGERRAGRVKRNENWWRYPDDMLASKVVRRLVKRYAAQISLGADPDDPGPGPAVAGRPAAAAPSFVCDDEPVDGEVVDEWDRETARQLVGRLRSALVALGDDERQLVAELWRAASIPPIDAPAFNEAHAARALDLVAQARARLRPPGDVDDDTVDVEPVDEEPAGQADPKQAEMFADTDPGRPF